MANPKGATELERIADVTSLPLVDGNQVCAVAYQGRVDVFEITRGTLNWSRDISSLAGIASDGKSIFVTDDKGAVQALDRSTGASLWKQDRLAERKIGGPQAVGEFVAVVDVEGYMHLLSATNGAYVGRLATDGTPATGQPAPFLEHRLAVGGRQPVRRHGEVDGSAPRPALAPIRDATAARHRRRTPRESPPCCPPLRSSAVPTWASPRSSIA